MDPRPASPRPDLNGAFTVTAQGAGFLTREEARGRGFVAPARGVRYPVDHPDPRLARASAALIGSGDLAVLTDVWAAAEWGLPLPPPIGLHLNDRLISVVTVGTVNRPRRGDVHGRRLTVPRVHVTVRRGLRLTTPARTYLDCAELISLVHLVALGDVLLRRGLATRPDLEAMVRWGRGRRGVVSARRAVPLLDGRAASPGESIVRAHLLLAGLPRPVCNLDIVEDGEWLARADLAWPERRLIVEYDGLVHLDETQRRRDAARRNLLQARGWRVITLTADDLRRPWLLVAQVRAALGC
jgi:hypothetical protein